MESENAIGIIDVKTGDIKIFIDPIELYQYFLRITGGKTTDELLFSVNKVERIMLQTIPAPNDERSVATDAELRKTKLSAK
jgi:hypothetical protein